MTKSTQIAVMLNETKYTLDEPTAIEPQITTFQERTVAALHQGER